MPVTTIAVAVALFCYLAVAVAYSRLQRRFALLGHRPRTLGATVPYRHSVDVIVPCYNEDPALLAACLRSVGDQDYQGEVRVWVVDDGSDNRDELLPVMRSFDGPGWTVLPLERNLGKREAQAAALREGHSEVLVMIDSDTVVARDGIRRIVAALHEPSVGAVTGNLQASNADATWLTRLIDTRYRLLFQRERAAQGLFGAVFCCAGPFSAYRRTVVEEVLPRYLGQQFWGRKRVCGDDLKLTNLVLEAGFDSLYEATATAATSVPTTLRRFVRQQLRWNRSFYRELPQMLRLLRGRSRYLALDLAARTLLPALLAVALAATAADALLATSRVPLDLAALVPMMLASLDLGPSPSRAAGRRFACGYGLIFIGLLLPARLWAVCTLFRNHWGTRDLPGYWPMRSSSLRALRSAIPFPFSS